MTTTTTTKETQRLIASPMIRDTLLNEKPKIDTAIKSFASYLLSGMSNAPWELSDVLSLSRKFSKFINQHFVSIKSSASASPDRQEQAELTAQIWNEMVASQQKPTKLLGRSALQNVWNDLELSKELRKDDNEEWNIKVDDFVALFFEFLQDKHDDAKLLWDVDRGQAELARRAADRQERAALNRQSQQQVPQIEELPPDE